MNAAEWVATIVLFFGVGIGIQVFAQVIRRGRG